MHRYKLFFMIIFFPFAMNLATAAEPSVIEGTIDDLARGIATYFPAGTGTVLSVDQKTVQIKMNNGAGLSPGLLLSAIREGEPFYHPVTHDLLGHFEEEIALLEITSTQPNQIATKTISSSKPILPTDLIRLTATKIPMAIATDETEGNRFLTGELLAALKETGRFTTALLPPQSTITSASATRSPYFIAFTTRADSSISVRMQNIKTEAEILQIQMKLQAKEGSSTVDALQQRLFEKHKKQAVQ